MLQKATKNQTPIDRPDYIEEKHWSEWLLGSCVHPLLIMLNVVSLAGGLPFDYLLYALPSTERRNDGRLRNKHLNRYKHLQDGGFWVSGLDPMNNWAPMLWGRFKPDIPTLGFGSTKPIKYESPPKTPNRLTYFNIPDEIWDLIAKQYNIKRYYSPLGLILAGRTTPPTFWEWVIMHPEIPIVLCEGEKKAAAMLSIGYVAIALPGIWGGRVGKKDFDERLHPDLIPLAQKKRKIIILFDYETKRKTRYAVFQAITRTAEAIAQAGCTCEIASLPGPEKGVDDFIKANPKDAALQLTRIIKDAKTLKDYIYSFLRLHRGLLSQYKADIKVNVKYLSEEVKLPESGLVVLHSEMGTGKTELMHRWLKEHPNSRLLNNGHRVNLLKNMAQRLETEIYSDLSYRELTTANTLSITIDSLHKLTTAALHYDCLFIDEACQYIVHLLHSPTCKKYRAQILEILQYLVYTTKLVVIADAHMDDITIDFFLAIRPQNEKPFIIKNNWKIGERQIYWYEGNDSSSITAQIAAALLQGQKILVASDSKSYIKKLELLLHNQTGAKIESDPDSPPGLKIWSIHGDNSGSPENIIFIKNIKTAILDIDALLYSPSVGMGVDMSEYHFDVIFGVFHAKPLTATECAQMLYRYRPHVPMHIWVAPRPMMGYQETNFDNIKEHLLQSNEVTAFLLKIDRETGIRGVEKDWALNTYCQIQAARNQSINNLRQDLYNLLQEMGNRFISMGGDNQPLTKEQLQKASQALEKEYCLEVTQAKDISFLEYQQRQSRDYLSQKEIFECEKHRIQQSYGMEVTEELVAMDHKGGLLRAISGLEAILAPPQEMVFSNGKYYPTPPKIVTDKDILERQNYLLCFDWANYAVEWLVRFNLGLQGILQRLIAGEEVTAKDPDLVKMREIALQFAGPIKSILGFSVTENPEPIWLLGVLLNKLGLKLVSCKRGSRGKQVKLYTLSQPEWEFAQKVIVYREQKRKQKENQRRNVTAQSIEGYRTHPNSSAVYTPPPNSRETPFRDGVDTSDIGAKIAAYQPDDGDSTPIELCIKLLRETCILGVEAIKGLLSKWSEQRRWGVMLLYEEIAAEELRKLIEQVPEFFSWLNESALPIAFI